MACIIVLGCYRTGTSAVAGVLHHLGVMMGKEFDKPAKSNPKGYYEDTEFKRLYSMLVEGREVEGNIDVLIRLREAEFPLWGVKDPQLCLLLPKFAKLLKAHKVDTKVITTLRPKEDICDSLSRAMNGLVDESPKNFEPLVDYYLARKDAALSVYDGPVLEVGFEEIGTDSAGMVARIAEFVGVPVTQEALNHVEVHP